MRAWLASCAVAARIASDRVDLWAPGALTWLAFGGWIPLLVAVDPLPAEADLAFFGARLVTSSAWPLNALALGLAAALVVLLGFALGALGEAALRRDLEAGHGPLHVETLRLFAVGLVAAVPTALALGALTFGLAQAAPDEFQSPDIGGGLGIRIVGRVAPLILALVLALLVSHLIGAAAGRRVTGPSPLGLTGSLRGALHDLRRSTGRLTSVAVASLGVSGAYLAAATLLLRVLWAPIGEPLAAGLGIDAGGALLLVGFVAIWLCLLLGGGALHAWASTWWSLELAGARRGGAERSRSAEATTSA